MNFVTQDGVTNSQPGMGVSFTTSSETVGCILNVHRYYHEIPNSIGGIGVIKRCDNDGKWFPDVDTARDFAFDHGYLKVYRRVK